MLRSRLHATGFAATVRGRRRPLSGTRHRIRAVLTGQCVALSNSTVKRRKTRFAGLGWVRGRGEARDGVTVKRGSTRGIGSMATQPFSTRSACAVAPLHAPRATALTNIGRSPNIPWRAVKGGPRLESLSGLAPGASRLDLSGRGARPSFPRPRRAAGEPRHAAPARGGRVLNLASRQLPPRTAQGATLGQGGIPMSQIAPAVGTAPARRLGRPAAGGCGSEQFRRGELLASRNSKRDRAAHRDHGARPARRANPSHHPATAATAPSRRALASSNHSDMAAH
jgi:hypothetical protein